MNREELEKEIDRVKTALEKTTSRKLKHDYGKYLRKLYKQGEIYGKRAEFDTAGTCAYCRGSVERR